MSITKEGLLQRAIEIKDETQKGANTATRVGGLLEDMIEYLSEVPEQEIQNYTIVEELPETIDSETILLYNGILWRGLKEGESTLPTGTPWPTIGYKEYSGSISQSGTDDPTINIYQNCLCNIVWTRSDVGTYLGTLSTPELIETRLFVIIGNTYDIGGADFVTSKIDFVSDDVIMIRTYSADLPSELNLTDGLLDNTNIQIRVYLPPII